jgi:thiamine-monophosphate kinase
MPPHLLTEFEFIRHLRETTPMLPGMGSSIVTGIGDDAAVVKVRPGHLLLATTDLLAERVHFDLAYMTYRQVGYRAAVANLSDMAAMGATPRYVLVAVALGPKATARDAKTLYSGIQEACTLANTMVIGGDTSASPSGLFVCLTVLGEAKPDFVLTRAGARKGDALYVTGTLGDSRAGREILRDRTTAIPTVTNRDRDRLVTRHIRPTARLGESRLLAAARVVNAAIDLSDGLAGDLRRICAESRVGAIVDLRRLPVSQSLLAYSRARRKDALQYALTGGEDYELLFTVPLEKVAQVERAIRRGQLCATSIGRITPPQQGLQVISVDGKCRILQAHGYEHLIGKNGNRR